MSVSVLNIFNVTCTLADTEYSQQLSAYNSSFEIKTRNLAPLKLAFMSGASGMVYWSLPSGSSAGMKFHFAGRKTLYFQTPSAGEVVEILETY